MNNDEKIISLLENLITSVSEVQSDITEIKGKINSIYYKLLPNCVFTK